MSAEQVSIGIPPTRVSQSFRPVGGWQLHLVRERISFRCQLCETGQSRVLWAATQVSSPDAMACQPCYRKILRRHYRNAASASPPVTAQGKKPRPQEPGWVRGALGVEAFFQEAGIEASLAPDGSLHVNGRTTRPLPQLLPPEGTFDWDEVIDEMTVRYAAAKFIQAVQRNSRLPAGTRAFLRRGDLGIAIIRNGLRLGLIRATHAYVPGRASITANFLAPGPHWQELATLVREAEPELLAAAREPAPPAVTPAGSPHGDDAHDRAAPPLTRCIRQFPAGLAPELAAACLDASRRLRLDRQVAYERPVVLISGHAELTLLPVRAAGGSFKLPFRFTAAPMTVQAELVLADSDPLPLNVAQHIPDESAMLAWTSALLGFADITCINFSSPAAGETEPRRQRPRTAPPAAGSSPHSARGRQAGASWPGYLTPANHWTDASGSLVAGHRRHLRHGATASTEALRRALAVGIVLRPQETWVRPHARGIPDGAELRFHWHAPQELTLLPGPPAHDAAGQTRPEPAK